MPAYQDQLTQLWRETATQAVSSFQKYMTVTAVTGLMSDYPHLRFIGSMGLILHYYGDFWHSL